VIHAFHLHKRDPFDVRLKPGTSHHATVGAHLAAFSAQMEIKTLAELLDQNVEISVADAVAVAQQLISDPDALGEARAPYGPPTLESVGVTAEGTVRCLHTAATPTVVEVGLVLHNLLVSSHRVPGRLRYTVSRALHEVEAPPFESAQDFSTALERFETGDRREQIAGLYEHAGTACPSDAGVVSLFAPAPSVSAHAERRIHQRSAAELRQQLREADLRLYEARRLSTPDHRQVRKSQLRRAPIAACMVAGAALVAAGEMARVGQRAPAPVASQPSPSLEIATNVPADAGPELSVAAAPPVKAPDVSPRPTAGRASGKPTAAKAHTVTARRQPQVTSAGAAGRSTTSSRSPARKADEPRPAKEREKPDNGLLRIRFVWNNPFR